MLKNNGYQLNLRHFELIDMGFLAHKSQKYNISEEAYSTGCLGLSG